MFGSNKEKKKGSRANAEEVRRDVRVDTLTFVGPGVEIEGSVTASAPLRIDGAIRGEIEAKGEVSVGESGYIEGRVHAESILIAGQVSGNVAVTKQLRLLPSGRLIGDAKTPNLIIEEGALFKGECEMTGPAAEIGAAQREAAAAAATDSNAGANVQTKRENEDTASGRQVGSAGNDAGGSASSEANATREATKSSGKGSATGPGGSAADGDGQSKKSSIA